MEGEKQDPREVWSTSPLVNARLILDVMTAMLAGNVSTAYLVQKLDNTVDFRLGALLNDAEQVAHGLLIRGEATAREAKRLLAERCAERGNHGI